MQAMVGAGEIDPTVLTMLALLIATHTVPGCRTVGSALHCELDAPVRPSPPASAKPLRVKHPRRPHEPHHSWHHYRRRSHAAPPPDEPAEPPPPTDAEIQKNIDSLVAIGDCSGVRAYTASMRTVAAADTAYRACVGRGQTAPAAPPSPPAAARPTKP